MEDVALSFTYTNWKGATDLRTVVPRNLWFGLSPYHKGAQWFMTAFDLDKQAERDFALKDCQFGD